MNWGEITGGKSPGESSGGDHGRKLLGGNHWGESPGGVHLLRILTSWSFLNLVPINCPVWSLFWPDFWQVWFRIWHWQVWFLICRCDSWSDKCDSKFADVIPNLRGVIPNLQMCDSSSDRCHSSSDRCALPVTCSWLWNWLQQWLTFKNQLKLCLFVSGLFCTLYDNLFDLPWHHTDLQLTPQALS